MDDIKNIPVKLSIDTNNLDRLTAKASQLKSLLQEVKELAASPDVVITISNDFCPKCFRNVEKRFNYCPKCGAKLRSIL